jgi:DNA-binding NarL/FixJ family response regulator
LVDLAGEQGISAQEVVQQWVEARCEARRGQRGAAQSLTPKQTQVLGQLKAGLTVKEIAAKLEVGERTIRTHILRMRAQLDCRDLLSLRFRSSASETGK